MSLLHAYLTDDFGHFETILRKYAEATPGRPGKQKSGNVDINAIDYLGRTILHLASSEGRERYVRALAACKGIDLAKPDRESGWTALHRALYSGNVLIARFLLQCKDIRNTSRRDLVACTDSESNTAFDAYNSTVSGVNPPFHDVARGGSDLYMFGSNANHTLGFSDADDRAFPERVDIKRPRMSDINSQNFRPLRIRDVFMAKYHTVVLTTDSVDNILTCGFAKNGRLGIAGGTQFVLKPVPIPGQVVAVATAQDHSLVVTKTGDLYSWGSNSNGQLGYEIETSGTYSSSPRKVIRLAKENVFGVAASVCHSVCFTEDSLYTWGRNDGALGYEVIPQEGKIVHQPRKVTSLSGPVKQVTATRYATVCLLATQDVIVFTNYGYFKLSLQLDRFASQYQVFRPKQAFAPSTIVKVVSGSSTVAVMTSMGDVFSFVLDETTSNTKPVVLGKSIKPGRVWSLRKKHMAVRDVAVGQEGTIIMCTESGATYIGRSRVPKRGLDSSKIDYKFSRMSGITRVVQVRANESGAFGVIREDVQLSKIRLDATDLAEDLLCTLPYSNLILSEEEEDIEEPREDAEFPTENKSENDEVVPKHVQNANAMLRSAIDTSEWIYDEDAYDVVFTCGKQILPSHKTILCARGTVLSGLMHGRDVVHGLQIQSTEHNLSITVDDKIYSFEALIILIHWLYTDIVLCPWFGCSQTEQKRLLEVKKTALSLATALKLKPLSNSLAKSFVSHPGQTLAKDISKLLLPNCNSDVADMRLLLQDGEMLIHSTVLAARSEFFGAMVSGAWINSRRSESSESVVSIDVKHISVQVMQIVIQHVFCDLDHTVFENAKLGDLDEYLDLIISVMAASTELLLPRLKQACQAVLALHVHRKNVAVILEEADRYSADELKEGCLDYCAKNLQFLLEKDLLGSVSDTLMHDLELYIARKQIERLPISKSGTLQSQLIQRNPSILDESELLKQQYLKALLNPKPVAGHKILDVGSQSMLHTLSTQSAPGDRHSPSLTPGSVEEPSLMFDMEAYDLSDVVGTVGAAQPPNSIAIAPPHNPESDREQVTTAAVTSAKVPVHEDADTDKNISAISPRGWKAQTTVQPTTDLRSVLSSSLARANRVNNQEGSWSPVSNNKATQKERKRQLMNSTTPATPPSAGTSLETGSPWSQRKSSPVVPLMSIAKAQESSPDSKRVGQSHAAVPSKHVPIIDRRPSATHQSSSYSKSNGSYSKSYLGSSPSPALVPQGLSLGDIIAAEEAAKTKMVEYNARRSMKEIQEQEAFELWFSKESARVKREEEASAALITQLSESNLGKSGKKQSNKAKKSKIKSEFTGQLQGLDKAVSSIQNTKLGKTSKPTTKTQSGFQTNPTAAEFIPKFGGS